eukprot:Skav236227  [mRNA]  locus=scaffold132:332990:333391:- [translate_table: standard]
MAATWVTPQLCILQGEHIAVLHVFVQIHQQHCNFGHIEVTFLETCPASEIKKHQETSRNIKKKKKIKKCLRHSAHGTWISTRTHFIMLQSTHFPYLRQKWASFSRSRRAGVAMARAAPFSKALACEDKQRLDS